MSRKVVILLVAMAAVVLLIAGMSWLKGGSETAEESSSPDSDISEIIVVPAEMPGGITLDIPAGFEETSSAYYDKYYVKNDASIIVTGEELTDYSMNGERYIEEVKKQYEQSAPDFKISSEDTFQVSGVTGYLIEFSYSIPVEDNHVQMGCLTAVVVKEGFAYIITCKSHRDTFPNHNNAFRKILATMDIADKTTSETGNEELQVTDASVLPTETTAVS